MIKVAVGTSVRLLGRLGVDLTGPKPNVGGAIGLALPVAFVFEQVNPTAADSSGYVIGLGGSQTQTRAAVVKLLLEEGPITASEIGTRLGLSAAGVRRHLDALIESGEARTASASSLRQRGRGRPAKQFQITATGRGRLGHTYDDLAGAAMRQLREIGGDAAIEEFAKRRVQAIVGDVEPADPTDVDNVEATADAIAEAFNAVGFAASTRPVGNGVQICGRDCPLAR